MLKHPKSLLDKLSLIRLTIILLALGSLACSLGLESSEAVRVRITLPTITPTTVAPAPAVVSVETNPPGDRSAAAQITLATATPARRRHLPTLTPTPQPVVEAVSPPTTQQVANSALAPTSTATPLSQSNPPTPSLSQPNPTATAPSSASTPGSPAPLPTLPSPVEPTGTPKSEVDGWSFRGVQTWLDQGDAIVVGEIINNTGSPQQAVDISGIFYDIQEQVIQEEIDTLSHVPAEVVPVGAHIPFELVVNSSQPIYRLDLLAMSEPAIEAPRQDFQFANVTQKQGEASMYCLEGQVQNSGLVLEDFLVIIATGYNEQGNVVNFDEYSPVAPDSVLGDQRSPFQVCIDPLNQRIARHELRALGY